MSVRVMTLVWELDLPDSEKLVLLALADCASDEGHCWPGMNTLKRKCSKSDRTIQLSIKMLCAKGHLTRREVPGKGCNYTVHPIIKLADPRSGITPEATSPPKGTTQTPEAASGKPSVTIISEAKASVTRVLSLWSELSKASGIPDVRVLNHSRTQMLLARVKEHGEATMLEAVRRVHASPFCRGLEGDGRKADIMLILQPKTLPRVLEGFYGGELKREPTTDEQVAALERMILAYEEGGRPDLVEQARSRIAALRAPTDPNMAANVASITRSAGREKCVGRAAA